MTRIINNVGSYCLAPASKNCEPSDRDYVYAETSSSICNSKAAYFNYDKKTGRLIHHCSGKTVCPNGIGPSQPLILTDSCWNQDIDVWHHTFHRDYSKL